MGREELGLVGSTAYVEGLPQAELDKIAMYINYDMVGSPNYVFQVYDANESTFAAPVVVQPGSEAIEAVVHRGRHPSGGLFTGAEQVKTEEQEMIWGGTTGEQFDPCCHLACDDYEHRSARTRCEQ